MITGNEPVTPHLTYNETSGHANGFVEGMTIRQHYAGLAMQGLLSNADALKDIRKESGDDWDKYGEMVAAVAVALTDALIAQLNKTN